MEDGDEYAMKIDRESYFSCGAPSAGLETRATTDLEIGATHS